jgi:hypothetical protein
VGCATEEVQRRRLEGALACGALYLHGWFRVPELVALSLRDAVQRDRIVSVRVGRGRPVRLRGGSMARAHAVFYECASFRF